MNPTRVKRLINLSESLEGRLETLKDELRPYCLILAEACGISSAKNISSPELRVLGADIWIKWDEWWKGEIYDTPSLRFPLQYLALEETAFRTRIEEIKATTRAHSPTDERRAKAQAQHEADERRKYEQLKAKFEKV